MNTEIKDMTNNDPLTDPDKAFGDLKESNYKAEIELVEKYQSFVAEILRLSLLGIAVFGYLYKDVFHTDSAQSGANIGLPKTLAAFGVLMFGVSAANALVFRFFATEGARFYIEAFRFKGIADEGRAQKSLDRRYGKIRICMWSKATAAVTLALGGLLVAVALFLFLVST